MSPTDLTLARNMLDLQKVKFAKQLGHSYTTFLKFEGGDKPIPSKTINKIKNLLKERGLRLPTAMDFSDRPYQVAPLQLRAPNQNVGGA